MKYILGQVLPVLKLAQWPFRQLGSPRSIVWLVLPPFSLLFHRFQIFSFPTNLSNRFRPSLLHDRFSLSHRLLFVLLWHFLDAHFFPQSSCPKLANCIRVPHPQSAISNQPAIVNLATIHLEIFSLRRFAFWYNPIQLWRFVLRFDRLIERVFLLNFFHIRCASIHMRPRGCCMLQLRWHIFFALHTLFGLRRYHQTTPRSMPLPMQ